MSSPVEVSRPSGLLPLSPFNNKERKNAGRTQPEQLSLRRSSLSPSRLDSRLPLKPYRSSLHTPQFRLVGKSNHLFHCFCFRVLSSNAERPYFVLYCLLAPPDPLEPSLPCWKRASWGERTVSRLPRSTAPGEWASQQLHLLLRFTKVLSSCLSAVQPSLTCG